MGETVLASEFGVIGFNSAAEAEAVDQRALLQAAIDYARASMAGVLELPAGHIAVADELDLFWERATHIEPLTLKGQGTRATALIANFAGVDKAMLRVVNPDGYGDGSDLNMRSTAMTISDMSWRVGSGIADPDAPMFLRYPNASDVRLSRLHANARNNSAIAMSGIFNSIVEDVTIFGGGHTFVRKNADGVTFSINQGETTLTASEAHFTAGDVGRVIKLSGEQQALVIDSVTNGTTAEVVETAQLASAARAAIWEPSRASIDDASNQLVFENACLAASDVGRWVYVFGARAGNTGGTLGSTSGTRPLRAQITAVSGDFTTATLDRNASATVADTVVVASPVFDISSTELQYNETNDFQITALNIEVFNSCALYIEEGLNLDLRRVKTHGRNVPVPGRPDLVTHFDAVLIRSSGYYRGDVEGFPVNPYGTIFVGDVITALSFDAVTGTSLEGAPGFIYWDNQNSYGSVRVHDLVHNNNLSARQADRIVGTTNPTPAPEVAGNRSWYRSSLRPTQVTATKKVSGFRTALQSFMRAVVGLGTEGFQAIGIGVNGIPTFRGSRVRGTEAAPAAVQQYDPLVSIDGEGRADDGEMVVAGRMVLRAKANPAAGNVEGEWLIARRNSAGTFTEVWVLNDDLVPVQDDVSYAGLGTNRLRGAYLGTFGATTELNGAVVPISTFIRRRGTDGAPSAVLDGDELMRIRAMGRADDGNDVEAARIAAFAYGAPAGGNLRGRLGLFVRTAAGALAEQWRVLEGALRPIGTQNLGAGDARINELHATRLRLYPGADHNPFNNGELNIDAPANNRLRVRYRGADGTERSVNLYLDVADDIGVLKGVGSPEGVVTAPIASRYLNKTGGAGQTFWVKESGSGNTGWVAK
ncbi:hypothetical protein [Devosia sp. I507]|uniref:hypothetical protein n=1 Tax=Devosia sp. I507 TaxID=2083786 RepID=UPI000CE9A381|nr:hypothetical protein [Devosia sp. I507]AVF05549.1 hypothetical protein C4375_18860 [Devosia sp. I507]